MKKFFQGTSTGQSFSCSSCFSECEKKYVQAQFNGIIFWRNFYVNFGLQTIDGNFTFFLNDET